MLVKTASPFVINTVGDITFIFCALAMAVVILLVGYLLARWAAILVASILKLIQIDSISKQIGLQAILEKGEIKKSVAELLGNVVYWIIIFVTVILAAKWLGLPVGLAFIATVIYLARVLMAAIILGLGLFFASLISGTVKVITINLGLEGAKTVSKVIYYVIVIFAFITALEQLGIKPDVFIPQIGVIIGAFGLAAAIAFGLGCKDMAADFLYNLFKGK